MGKNKLNGKSDNAGRGGGVLGGRGFYGENKKHFFNRRLGGSSRRDNRIPLGGKFSLSARVFLNFLRGLGNNTKR